MAKILSIRKVWPTLNGPLAVNVICITEVALLAWICFLGDFLRILPWSITIFHHHLGDYFWLFLGIFSSKSKFTLVGASGVYFWDRSLCLSISRAPQLLQDWHVHLTNIPWKLMKIRFLLGLGLLAVVFREWVNTRISQIPCLNQLIWHTVFAGRSWDASQTVCQERPFVF